jgi:signal peptidase II
MNTVKADGKTLFFFLTTFIIVLLDQLIKWIVIVNVPIGPDIRVIPQIIHITHVLNTGAGFGIFQGQKMILAFVSIIFIIGLIYYLPKIRNEPMHYLPYALILGGAVGNLIDRLFREGVVDFIRIIFWPAFNLADSTITIGVLWILILGVIDYKKSKEKI